MLGTLQRYIIHCKDHPSSYVSTRTLGEAMIENFNTRDAAERVRKALDNPENFEVCEVVMVIEGWEGDE